MIDTYQRLLALESSGVRYDTGRIERMLEWLDHPERVARRTLSVAGTNGKGSVSATVSAAATAAGWRVGMFTSPHLIRPHERFRVDDVDMDHPTFTEYGSRVLTAIERSGIPLSFFEAMLTLALLRFADHRCDLQILEAGLGGARDATAAVPRTHVIITGIARDHTRTLGPSLTHIAREKLALCTPGVPAILNVPPRLRHLAPPGWLLGRDIRYRCTRTGVTVTHPDGTLRLPIPRLPGPHQRRNLALAATAASRLGLPEPAVITATQTVRWPARMQRLPGPVPTWLDGAHNPDAAAMLLRTLTELTITPGFTLVFSAHARKHTRAVLQTLAAPAGQVIITTTDRLCSPAELAAHLPGRPDVTLEPDPLAALRRAWTHGRTTVVAGSLYLAGALLGALENDPYLG